MRKKKVAPDPFMSLSLASQCDDLGIPLGRIRMEKTEYWWWFAGEKFPKPEQAAYAYLQSLGFSGTYCEGYGPLTLMKCACLDLLAKWSTFPDRTDSCTRYFEAQCMIYAEKSDMIVDAIRAATTESVLAALEEIQSIPRYQINFPMIQPDGVRCLWDSLGGEGWANIARAFVSDPYRFRSGWPDLSVSDGKHIKLVEVKTTDKLHGSQRDTITSLLVPLGFSVSVLQIMKGVR